MNFDGYTACELIAGLKKRTWSSVELTTYYLNKVNRSQSCAVVSVNEQYALNTAKKIDKKRNEGQYIGLLQGLPFTVKDSFKVSNQVTTWGMSFYKSYKPKKTSLLIDALIKEDGVIFGRTAVPTGSFDWNCKNQIHSECKNPYDSSRTPGGSSGGAAAALASKLTPIEIGSDIAGSIRYPAHCCGVFGLRTTENWLPIKDTGPENAKFPFSGLVVPGPMGNSIEDIQFILDVIEKHFPNKNKTKYLSTKLKNKVAYNYKSIYPRPSLDAEKLLGNLNDNLIDFGITLVDDFPKISMELLYKDWCTIVGYEYSNSLPKLLMLTQIKKIILDNLFFKKIGDGFMRKHLLAGMSSTQKEYNLAIERKLHSQKIIDEFLAEYDFWILPNSAIEALPLELSSKEIKHDNRVYDYTTFLGNYLCPTAMFGTPVVSLPIGKIQGLPYGVQVHGRKFRDQALLSNLSRIFPFKKI